MISDMLDIKKGITSIIGSGGKTTLMYVLAQELSNKGRVIVASSTKIYPPEHIITLEDPSEEDIKKALAENPIICVGKACGEGKLTAPDMDFERLEKLADYVLCEADGSKGLPLKAHGLYEPVIPPGTTKVIQVMGASGIGGRIKDVCHRPDIYASLAGKSIEDEADADSAARVIKREGLGQVLIINQAASLEDMENAAEVAEGLNIPVWAGEIRKGNLICLR